jgi:hypothetical protein
MKNPEDNLIVVMTGNEITKLYKTLLEIVEDLQKDHEIMLDKVAQKTDSEFASNVNYFTKAKYEQLRKRILDTGNECDRNITNFLSFFDSTINVQKVNEAAQQKMSVKKTFVSQPIIV